MLLFFVATVAFFICGLYIGWSGPTLRKILSDEYPFDVSEDELSYIVIIGPIGDIVGGILSTSIVDIIGRKWTILCLAIPQFLNFVTIYFSYYSVALLYVGRFVGGIAEGAVIAIVPIYIAEVSEPEVRGLFGSFISTTFILGKLVMNLLGSYIDIYNTALICMIFSLFFVCSFIHMPESPYYLLMKQIESEAEASLKILRRKYDVKKELGMLSTDVQRQMSESGTFMDLFKIKSNRKALLLVHGIYFFMQFTGITAYSMYLQILLEQGTNLSPILGSSLVIIGQLVSNTIASLFVDKLGRKPLLIFSITTCCAILFSLATFYTLKDLNFDLSDVLWIPLLLIVLFILCFQSGLGILYNVFVGEIYSTSIKTKALFVGSISHSIFMITSTKFYQLTADRLGSAVPFYCFGCISLLGVFFIIFKIPETKGKTLEQIQQELKGHKVISSEKS